MQYLCGMKKTDYPHTETEIRVYCLEASRGNAMYGSDEIDIERAQELYDFIRADYSKPSVWERIVLALKNLRGKLLRLLHLR